MDTLQQEAIARMREMQSRASTPSGTNQETPNKNHSSSSHNNGKHNNSYNNSNQFTETNHETNEHGQKNQHKNTTPKENQENISTEPPLNNQNGILGSIGKSFGLDFIDNILHDKEQVLILLMTYILGKEKADSGLILALLYIAL